MTSEINPAVIIDNQPVDKEDLRTQFQTAKDEITELQNVTTVTRKMAVDDAQFDTL